VSVFVQVFPWLSRFLQYLGGRFFAQGAQGTLIGETNHGVLWKKWASVTGAMLLIEF
jgi:hypothetical protein